MQDQRARLHFNHQWSGFVLCIPLLFFLLNHVSPILCSSPFMNHGQVRYWELQRLNSSCYPRDSCREKRPLDNSLVNNNCLCDKTCATYDVCCLDSPYRFFRPIGRPNSTCTFVSPFDSGYGVLMVNQCRPDYTGDAQISELCSGEATELNDPILLLPVTNTKTGITYKNYFCSACNDDVSRRHNVFWTVQLTSWVKNISQSEITNLRFDPEIQSWTLPNSNGTSKDIIDVQVTPPVDFGDHIKRCPLSVTSDCAEGWPYEVIRRKCATYMAIVAIPDRDGFMARFRNIHCAICNGLMSPKGVSCEWTQVGGFGWSGRPGLSFALLLDVNRSDGDRVGLVQRCSENEMYDPFFKRCRVLKCALPGYAIKNGNCVKQ